MLDSIDPYENKALNESSDDEDFDKIFKLNELLSKLNDNERTNLNADD
jgi:hypothetical protein